MKCDTEFKALKDGKGNIIMPDDSFDLLLSCLSNQKNLYTTLNDINIDVKNKIQNRIEDIKKQSQKILQQKYVFSLSEGDYYLSKRYEYQNDDTEWSGKDVGLVYELFKDTRIVYEKREDLLPLDGSEKIKEGDEPIGKTADEWIAVEPEPRPWLIERPLMYDGQYLTISEDGFKNRPWKQEEVEQIKLLFDSRL